MPHTLTERERERERERKDLVFIAAVIKYIV
jgi:hypothetical protein